MIFTIGVACGIILGIIGTSLYIEMIIEKKING